MQLLQFWKESLSIFKPVNFKLFLLVTLKTIIQTYKVLFKYFWWLFGLLIVLGLWAMSLEGTEQQALVMYLVLLRLMVALFVPFIVLLIIRSSVSKKNVVYFMQHISFVIPIFSLSFLIPCFYLMIRWWAETYYNLHIPLKILSILIFVPYPYLLAPVIFQVWLSPLIILFGLFYLDTGKIFYSLKWAIKMIVYNYPVLFILYTVLLSIVMILWKLFFMYLGSIDPRLEYILVFASVYVVLIPIFYSVVSNIYIKQVHDNFDLYFGKGPSEKEGV